jgi:hypothetical protein
VLFPAQEVLGCEHYYVHNYMIITSSHGISFVFDPSGYQFGYSKILYTLEEYEADIVYGEKMPEEDDIEDAIDTHTRIARVSLFLWVSRPWMARCRECQVQWSRG